MQLLSSAVDILAGHWNAMCSANQVVNLTRITDPMDAARKHYADSLALIASGRLKAGDGPLLDIGTGAGFPAVPLACSDNELDVTAIDSRGKKIQFLRDWLLGQPFEVVRTDTREAAGQAQDPTLIPEEVDRDALALPNLTIVHAHSDHWESERVYTWVVARAVAAEKALHHAERHLSRDGTIALFSTPGADFKGVAPRGIRMVGTYDYAFSSDDGPLNRRLAFFQRG
ncbi:MAG: 16S rRNA (guanine(527)-N(7))-methyltransferase RsmG [Phycisphaerae bacterium]